MNKKNRYAKKCNKCKKMVQEGAGFLSKENGKFQVYHEECFPSKTYREPNNNQGDFIRSSEVLSTLEHKLIARQLAGQPVVYLPTIINHIKELEDKVRRYESELSSKKESGYSYSITGERTCKSCGHSVDALDQ